MNKVIGIIVIAIVIIGGFFVLRTDEEVVVKNTPNEISEEMVENKNTETQNTTESASNSEEQEEVVVRLTDSGFVPKVVTINQGESVTWINESGNGMWVASANHPTHTVYPEKSDDNCLGSDFDACRSFENSESWSFTFDTIGEWKYHNHVRASQTGTVIVE